MSRFEIRESRVKIVECLEIFVYRLVFRFTPKAWILKLNSENSTWNEQYMYKHVQCTMCNDVHSIFFHPLSLYYEINRGRWRWRWRWSWRRVSCTYRLQNIRFKIQHSRYKIHNKRICLELSRRNLGDGRPRTFHLNANGEWRIANGGNPKSNGLLFVSRSFSIEINGVLNFSENFIKNSTTWNGQPARGKTRTMEWQKHIQYTYWFRKTDSWTVFLF